MARTASGSRVRLRRLPKLPVRFYMEVGVYETDRSPNQGPGQVWPNRHFRDVLRAKGYDVDYREFAGAHEYLNWRGTISDALAALLPERRPVSTS